MGSLSNILKALAVVVVISTVSAGIVCAAYTDRNDYQVTEKVIHVKLIRGDLTENGFLVYRGWARKVEREKGGVSKPLQFKFVDDRECSWSVTAHMTRQYFVKSLMGQDYGQAVSIFNIPITVRGGSNGIANIFDHDPCRDYRRSIDSDVEEVIRRIRDQFDEKTNEDFKRLKEGLSGINVIVTDPPNGSDSN